MRALRASLRGIPGSLGGFCASSLARAFPSFSPALSARAFAFSVFFPSRVRSPLLSALPGSAPFRGSPALSPGGGSPSRRSRSEGRARSLSCLNFSLFEDFGPTWPEVVPGSGRSVLTLGSPSSSNWRREEGPGFSGAWAVRFFLAGFGPTWPEVSGLPLVVRSVNFAIKSTSFP